MQSEAGNELTFFMDPKIENEFMTSAIQDLQSMSSEKIKTTDKQVNNRFNNCIVVWKQKYLGLAQVRLCSFLQPEHLSNADGQRICWNDPQII